MLGQKRNASIFAAAAKKPEITKAPEVVMKEPPLAASPSPDPVTVSTISPMSVENDELQEALKLSTTGRAHSLFFTPQDDSRDFASVLQEVQGYIASNYAGLMTEAGPDSREQIKRYTTKYLQDKRIAVKGMSPDELVDAIYAEMAEYGFLTKFIFGEGVEEIDINSWRDIEVQYSDGRNEKLAEHFDSPEHAVNVIRRMLHVSGVILDNASPVVVGTLSQNIRIAAMKTPVVDEDVGVAASIRIVNPQSMTKEDFIRGGSATVEMLDFLAACLRYGISICIAGATSSGKTTVAGWLLTTIPNNKRIFTIENGSRELALVREKDGAVTNSVVHTLTRDSENERQRVTQIMLLDIALRFNPDILVVGEMRGAEANAAQEAARTGVAVLTTIHSNSCEATYRRMVSLCKRAVEISDETLMGYVTEAYPLVVFCKQLEDKQRKLMEIMECEIQPDGTRRFNTLFRYHITENRLLNDNYVIKGCHEQVCDISQSLRKRLIENGMPYEQLQALTDKGKQGTPENRTPDTANTGKEADIA